MALAEEEARSDWSRLRAMPCRTARRYVAFVGEVPLERRLVNIHARVKRQHPSLGQLSPEEVEICRQFDLRAGNFIPSEAPWVLDYPGVPKKKAPQREIQKALRSPLRERFSDLSPRAGLWMATRKCGACTVELTMTFGGWARHVGYWLDLVGPEKKLNQVSFLSTLGIITLGEMPFDLVDREAIPATVAALLEAIDGACAFAATL